MVLNGFKKPIPSSVLESCYCITAFFFGTIVSNSLGSQRISGKRSWNIVHAKDGTWKNGDNWNQFGIHMNSPFWFLSRIFMDIQAFYLVFS